MLGVYRIELKIQKFIRFLPAICVAGSFGGMADSSAVAEFTGTHRVTGHYWAIIYSSFLVLIFVFPLE
jgi:hypothetical protein